MATIDAITFSLVYVFARCDETTHERDSFLVVQRKP